MAVALATVLISPTAASTKFSSKFVERESELAVVSIVPELLTMSLPLPPMMPTAALSEVRLTSAREMSRRFTLIS